MNHPADAVYARRPAWVGGGHIGLSDARYLFDRIAASSVETIVEIGTASGVSTAILCEALSAAHRAGAIGPDYRVVSYDIRETFYLDASRRVGEAVHKMLRPEQVARIKFRHPATAIALREHHEPDEVGMLFIDASHRHPWPALDLLAALPVLRPGAEVILHDINLPATSAESTVWGVKYVFDELDARKECDPRAVPPNIGSVMVGDKPALERNLIAIVNGHEWEKSVPDELVACLVSAA